jgi:hypothetical protein
METWRAHVVGLGESPEKGGPMTRIQLTESTIAQARELVRAIQALDTVECPDPFERAVAELFQAAYKRRLMEMVEVVPAWMADEIRSASQHIDDGLAPLWVTED